MIIASVVALALSLAAVVYLVVLIGRAHDRADARIDALLERLERTPSVVLRPTEPDLMTPSEKKAYISEFEYDDKSWNDFVGAETEDDEA